MRTVEVDEEGLTQVAQRFLRRREVQELGLSLEDVKKILLEHAKRYGGCVNCVYSGPYHGRFTWAARHCKLGLRQDTCPMHKPIVKREKIRETEGEVKITFERDENT